MPKLQLQFIANDTSCVKGALKRRLILTVGGKQVVESVTLDSPRSKAHAAQRWNDRYGIDEDECLKRLDQLGAQAMADVQALKEKQKSAPPPQRVSRQVDAWLKGPMVDPKWHKKDASIYCQAVKREVKLADLWKLAPDAMIDGVANTEEGLMSGRVGEPPNWRTRLAIWKDAVAMGAARLIRTLPERNDIETDESADREELQARLVAWLIKTRTYRTEPGVPVSASVFDWACGVEPGGGWQRCFSDAIFGRMANRDGQPEIAVKGELLRDELRYETLRRLGSDLRDAGFADTDYTIKVTRKTCRVWKFTAHVVDSVATSHGKEA